MIGKVGRQNEVELLILVECMIERDDMSDMVRCSLTLLSPFIAICSLLLLSETDCETLSERQRPLR